VRHLKHTGQIINTRVKEEGKQRPVTWVEKATS